MPEVLSYEDIHQQYKGGVCLYKGEPVQVVSVNEDRPCKVRILHLISQKSSTVEFSLETFAPPNMRLGMLNTEYGAVYVSRVPVRRMQVGLSAGNIRSRALANAEYMENNLHALRAGERINSVEFGEMMLGQYPDFRTCIEFIKDFNTNVAFDRQFSIDSRFSIFYKTELVGNLPKNCRSPDRIQFLKGKEHLSILIGDTCEKTLAA